MNRRTFIRDSAMATIAGTSSFHIPTKAKNKGYRLALIGAGWWGNNILKEALAYGKIDKLSICDVDERALYSTIENVGKWRHLKPKIFKDYRELLKKSKPDIVIVATPDHWHALPAIAAMAQGADVYLEKPVGHTIGEGRAILNAARNLNRVVQVGTHRRISPHNISGMEFLWSGKVGHIHSVKAFVNYGSGPGSLQTEMPVPNGLDWDMWCGPAAKLPYTDAIHPKGFRQYLEFANGTIGDWGIHWFDQVLWWTEEKYPSRIFSSGDRFVKKDGSDAPDTQYALFEFESFNLHWEHKLCAPNAHESANVGCYFYGTEGTFHMGWRDGWTFYPKNDKTATIHTEPQLHTEDDHNIKELWEDFMFCIENRDRRKPVSDIEHGHLASNISLLAMISYKLGKSIDWDGANEIITNDEAANAMLKREYRGEWEYPG